MFKKKNVIARHNEKCAKRLRKFTHNHPQLTGVACTVGGINFIYRMAVQPIIKRRTEKCIDKLSDSIVDIIDKTTDAMAKAVDTVDVDFTESDC
jgi:hypothetical protein